MLTVAELPCETKLPTPRLFASHRSGPEGAWHPHCAGGQGTWPGDAGHACTGTTIVIAAYLFSSQTNGFCDCSRPLHEVLGQPWQCRSPFGRSRPSRRIARRSSLSRSSKLLILFLQLMGDSHHPGFKPCSGLDENSPLTTGKKALVRWRRSRMMCAITNDQGKQNGYHALWLRWQHLCAYRAYAARREGRAVRPSARACAQG